jgi:peptidoglycan hydrolase-like protein with peptidoglycan-binding domain
LAFSIIGRNLVRSLGVGPVALFASAMPAVAATTHRTVPARPVAKATQSASSKRSTSQAGNGGAGIGSPSTTKVSVTAGGAGTGTGSSGAVLHLGDRTLRQGMRGRDVKVLQDYLTRVGYRTTIDGDFGPGTSKNVRAFERAVRMKADGVVTLAVSNALRLAVAKAQKANAGPVGRGHLNSNGTASPPANAPTTIKKLFAAANKIANMPYVYGGGHATWNDSGYDCSGSLSYALHGAGLLSAPMDSTEFESWGRSGPGHWISIWSNSGHTYMYVAGLRYDTSAQSSTGGSRWTTQSRSNNGFVETHPTGW